MTDKEIVEKVTDQNRFDGHFALEGKNKGSIKEFLGKVCFVCILVNDRRSAWSSEEEEKIKDVIQTAANEIKRQSGLTDNRLKISYAVDKVPIQYVFDRYESENIDRLVKDVLVQYGYEDVASYQEHYKRKFKKKEVPLIFFFNRDFRAFEHMDYLNGSEYSFVAFSGDEKECMRTLIHEVLHQFGAIDYYLPDRVKETAQKYLPDSIMESGSKLDDLTRYIIGWDKEMSESAISFLENTADITDKEIADAREKDSDNDW